MILIPEFLHIVTNDSGYSMRLSAFHYEERSRPNVTAVIERA